MSARDDLRERAAAAANRLAAGLRAREEAIKVIEEEADEVADYLAMIDALNMGGPPRALAVTKLREAREVLGDG